MLVAIPLDRMVPLPALFRHRSDLHGQAHVARVMVHAMRLVDATGRSEHGALLWASVFLHDLARTHDGVDRVRLGDLDPRYLRNAEAKAMVPFAQALFDATTGVIATGPAHFEQLLVAAQGL